MERRGGARSAEGLLHEAFADDRFLAWLDVLQAQARVTSLLGRELEAECGLPLAFYEILVRLETAPGRRVRMQELARSVFLSKSGVSRLVGRMEEAGLVVRSGEPTNLRITYASITEHGRGVLRDALPVQVRKVEEHFSRHLSLEEARVLRRALGKVIEAGGDVTISSGNHAPDPG